jgi:hypothetical protein
MAVIALTPPEFSRIDSGVCLGRVSVCKRVPAPICPTARQNASKVPKPTTCRGGTQCTAPGKLSRKTMGTRAHCRQYAGKNAWLVSVIHDLLPLNDRGRGRKAVWWAQGAPKCPNAGVSQCPAFASQDQLTGQHAVAENGNSLDKRDGRNGLTRNPCLNKISS